MAHGWYYRVLDAEFGPVPFDTLTEFAHTGHISRNDLVREGQRGQWQPAGDVYGLFASTAEWADVISALGGAPASPSGLDKDQRTLAELPPPPPDPAVHIDDFELSPRRVEGPELDDALKHAPDKSVDDAAARAAGTADAEAWYVRVLSQEFGPMPLSDVAAMAGNGELSDEDEVRQGIDADWAQAGSVPFLLASIVLGKSRGQRPRRASSAPADEEDFEIDLPLGAASSPPDAAVPRAPRPDEARVEEPFAGAAELSSPDATETSAPQRAASPIASRRTPVPVVKRRPLKVEHPSARLLKRRAAPAGAKVVVGLAAAVIAGTLVAYVTFSGSERTYYGTLDEVWRDLRAMRNRSATEDEWSQFSADAREKVQPIIKDLKRTAHADAPARQHLLWAAEDYLLPMLDDAREAPSESEQRFAEHLAEARRWIGK